jgi:biopolymer transport protein ExbB
VGEALIMTGAGQGVGLPAGRGDQGVGRRIGGVEADLDCVARDLRELLTHPADARRE